MAEHVLVEREGDVAILTINRPEVHNALNASVLASIAQRVGDLGTDGTRAVIITGSGDKAFSAGADLDELAGVPTALAHDILTAGQRTMSAIEASPVPVIAAVNGLALGGGFELILACTFSILADHAKLGLPETGLGLIPGYGGTQRLAALIGRAEAAHAMLTGERFTSARAHQLGLTPVSPVPGTELRDAALGIAQTVAARGPRAQAAVLTALQASAVRSSALALESALAGIATGGREAAEGIEAFREKRRAQFAPRGQE